MTNRLCFALVLAFALSPASLAAQVHSGGPLGDLHRAREGGLAHYSSADPKGAPAGPLMDGWAPRVEPTGPTSFGEVALRAGVNEIIVELVGKDARSAGYGDGYLVGVDGFLLLR